MKQQLLLWVVAFCALGFLSCQKQKNPISPESVALMTQSITDPSKFEPPTAGTRAVTIAATSEWTAVSNVTWISVSPSSGPRGIHEVILTYEENTTAEVRQGVVVFSSAKNSESYTLNQKP